MYAVLGYGEQGRAIVKYLLEHDGEPVWVADLKAAPESDPRITFVEGSEKRLFNSLQAKKVVLISCLPTEYNYDVARRCVSRGWSMIDLGGCERVSGMISRMNQDAARAGSCLIPDCGLAPGIVSSLAGEAARNGCSSVRIFCGGIPQTPSFPLGYVRSFSEEGLIKEYRGTALVRRKGRLESVPTLSEIEPLFVPGLGVLEAAPTSGSVSWSPRTLSTLETFEYKTLRYPGHWDYVRNHILTQPDPLSIMKDVLSGKVVSATDPDLIALVVEVDGEKTSYFWTYDQTHGLSAMSQATGYTVGAVATLVHDRMISKRGVLGMENIDPYVVINRARRMAGQYMPSLEG